MLPPERCQGFLDNTMMKLIAEALLLLLSCLSFYGRTEAKHKVFKYPLESDILHHTYITDIDQKRRCVGASVDDR